MQLMDMRVRQVKLVYVLRLPDRGQRILVTGIATAYMDSVPLVVITGNVATT